VKIKGLILGIYGILLLGLLYFLLTSYQNTKQAQTASIWVNHTHEVIEKLDNIEAAVFEYESGVRGYVISGHHHFVGNKEKVVQELRQQMHFLQMMVSDNPVQKKNEEALQRSIEEKLGFQQELIQTYSKNPKEALALVTSGQGKMLAEKIKNKVREMREMEKELLTLRIRQNNAITHKKFINSMVGAVAALFVFSCSLFLIYKENIRRRKAEATAKETSLRYKGLVENAAVVVCTINSKGQFDFMSNKCASVSGYTPEEMVGQYFTHIVAEEWKERVALFYMDQLKERKVESSLVFPILTKEGDIRWLDQTAILLTEGEEIRGFQCIIKDVTEKKKTEALLEEKEKEIRQKKEEYQFLLQSILDHIPMIVYLKDLEGRFLMINQRFKDTFGVTEKEVLGRTAYVINSHEIIGRHIEADEEVKSSLEYVEIEDTVITCEGERHMLITKFPLLDKNEKLFAICGVDKDISDMVRSRNELVNARLRAEEAEKLQEEFLANMSHEIRTPMNGIIGMTHVLSETYLTAAQTEYVQIIRQSSQSLLVLINDILDFSKIKAGKMALDEIDFNFREVIETVWVPMKLKAESKNIVLKKSIDERLPAFVWGDQHKLVQILNNLLSNAIKFTEEGRVELEVTTRESGEYMVYLQFAVKDTGIGIDPDKLDAVFESFVQAGNDMVRRFGGTGLGLSITKRLVELQGGSIQVESEKGNGSVFRFEIGYGKSDKEATDTPVEAPVEVSRFCGQKVLIVEDNEVNQKVIRTILENSGLTVSLAGNGLQAIEMLQQDRAYDMIIMDLQMPIMNGFQATTFIRNKLGITTPIIAMTASALRNERKKCFALGMNEYLTKPFAPAEILRQLSRFLQIAALKEKELPTKNANELYDLGYLQEMDDNEYVRDVLQLFLDTTPGLIHEMKTAAMHEQWEEVAQKAHKLKSSVGILQAAKMLEVAARIESLAKEKKELDAVPKGIENLFEQFNLMQPMLIAEIREAA
jgi:PAS domain S-box-containing protein